MSRGRKDGSRKGTKRRQASTRAVVVGDHLGAGENAGGAIIVNIVLVVAYLMSLALLSGSWAGVRESLLAFVTEAPLSLPADDAPVFLMGLGGVPLAFAVFALVSGAANRRRGRRRTARTHGEIESNALVSVPNHSGGTGSSTERHVEVAYEVDGERFVLELRYRMLASLRGPRRAFGPQTVYYEPALPGNSGLAPAWRERAIGVSFAIAVFGAVFMAGAIARFAAA